MSGGLAYESIVVRIDKFCHVHVGFPFLDLCVQNGSPRDALRQVVYVRISLRGHRRRIRLFCSISLTLEYGFRHIAVEQLSWGLRTALGHPSRMVDSLGCIYRDGRLGPTDWRRLASVIYRFSEVSEEPNRPYSLSISATREWVTASINRGGNANKRGEERRGAGKDSGATLINYCK
jgi:hypothetical protein